MRRITAIHNTAHKRMKSAHVFIVISKINIRHNIGDLMS